MNKIFYKPLPHHMLLDEISGTSCVIFKGHKILEANKKNYKRTTSFCAEYMIPLHYGACFIE